MFHPDEETLQLDEETVKETYDAEVTRPVTELRSVQQKGLGLQALRRSISIFSDPPMPYPHELQGTEEEKLKAYAMLRQKKIEDDAVISAVERWREENRSLQRLGMNTVLQTRSLGALMWEWQVALKAVVNEELRQIEASEGQPAISRAELDRSLYGPFLRLLSDDKLAAITILSTMSLLSRDTSDRWIRLSSILINVGSAVQEEATAEAIQKQLVPKAWSRPATAERQRKLANMMKRRRTFEALAREVSKEPPLSNDTLNSAPGAWSNAIKVKVGAVLVSALLRTAKMPVPRSNPYTKEDIVQVEPAFFHSYRILHGKSTGVILAHNSLAERLRKEPAQHSLAKHLPMVVEPRKWTSFTDGGFLQYPVNVMRTKGGTAQRRYVEAATARGDMEQVFTGLNILAKTPWKINRAILDVMTEAWNSGEAVADIAPEEPQLEDPVEPPSSADHNEKQQWIKSFREVENKRGGLHSLRCFQNFQLEVARAYANEKFYFPHNVDFRGRAYPTPPYLNHLGADNCRGLLMFADGRELGPAGLVWLKIHLANVYGYDKASFKERERFTLEHLTDIYDSASRPLNGNRWWLSAEDPWQCLATCMELKAALDSPDPSRFVSHLPVHQDGTCNGLQHYAALGGDLWGAKQVNLEPGDRPSDIYTAVAELVKKETARDVERGDPIAKTLLGKITRKVVKQTVMTNVYGVTFAGARAQVRKQLYDIMPEGPEHAGVDHGRMASYVARKIFRALASMFNGAHEIQYWLGECASRICQVITPEQMERMNNSPSSQGAASVAKAKPAPKRGSKDGEIPFMSTVIWTTPLRMPVVQPYYAEKAKVVVTNLQRVHIMESRPKDPVNRRKQLQAFPPNFIHSLDASHMLLSALKCEEAGLTFAAVHDSFWTHAANVDTMNRILRDAFIRIHSEDVIGRLAEEFKVRYKGCLYLASVSRTSTVGKKILAWRGAGSRDKRTGKAVLRGRNKMTELREEYKRQQLLKSDKAEEREEGRKMVTAGSIFEAAASEEDLASDERRVGLGIDDMRKRRGIGGRAALPSTTIGSDDKDVTESDSTTETDEILEKETDAEVEAESHIDSSTDKPPDEEEPEVEETSGKRGRKLDKRVRFWLPLTFPPVPKKVILSFPAFPISRRFHPFRHSTAEPNG